MTGSEFSMTERERVIRICADLALPEPQWVLSGSGVLIMHGIERNRPMGDLDLFVSTQLWFNLRQTLAWKTWTPEPKDVAARCDPPRLWREMYGLRVDVVYAYRQRSIGDIDVATWMHNAEHVEGIPCVPLPFLLAWKDQVGRDKDATDIELIKQYLGEP